MKITAALVKELREKTGSGMMECKKALEETQGDIKEAIVVMRKKGQAKAEKKGVRVTTEGLVNIKHADNNLVAIEINCETDFVARGDKFKQFSEKLLTILVENTEIDSVDSLLTFSLNTGDTVDDARKSLIATIGENITVRRFQRMNIANNEQVGTYLHGDRIGVIAVATASDNESLAKELAMHIAASKPEVINPSEYSAEKLKVEKEIYKAKLQESGKPEAIQNKILDGQINKFLKQVSLVGQDFVKDPSITVGELLTKNNAQALRFLRYELGEGLEKKVVDFAAEVKEQIKGI